MLVDFYKEYRIDLRGLETGSLDPYFMSILLDGLPSNCNVNRILYPDLALSLTEWLLVAIHLQEQISNYRWTEDAKHGRNAPEPLFKPHKALEEIEKDDSVMRLDMETMKALAALYEPGR